MEHVLFNAFVTEQLFLKMKTIWKKKWQKFIFLILWLRKNLIIFQNLNFFVIEKTAFLYMILNYH